MDSINRRPLETRSKAWAQAAARSVARSGLSPNQISVIGIGISLIGAVFLWATHSGAGNTFIVGLLYVLAAICVQLRLLCNMLDGLVAVEHNKKSPLGDLFNEVPDRIEDSLFLVAAGYASGTTTGLILGLLAALLAVSAAYVRLLGGSLGYEQDFCGPQAKQHRMFLLTLVLIVSAIVVWVGSDFRVLNYGLALITIGTLVTIIRRLIRIGKLMQGND